MKVIKKQKILFTAFEGLDQFEIGHPQVAKLTQNIATFTHEQQLYPGLRKADKLLPVRFAMGRLAQPRNWNSKCQNIRVLSVLSFWLGLPLVCG